MIDAVVGIVATALSGTIGWALKNSSRISVIEQSVKDSKELAESEQESLKELIENEFKFLDQRLGRIERAMNGALKGH